MDIIQNALQLTNIYSGKLFVFYDDCGELQLKAIENMALGEMLISDEGNLQDFTFTTDIDKDTYNRVRFYRDNDESGLRETWVAQDSGSMQKWGLLQYTANIPDHITSEQASEAAEVFLNLKDRVAKTLTVTCEGSPYVRGGSCIPVKIADVGEVIDTTYVVESCTHTFKNSEHTMKLEFVGDVTNKADAKEYKEFTVTYNTSAALSSSTGTSLSGYTGTAIAATASSLSGTAASVKGIALRMVGNSGYYGKCAALVSTVYSRAGLGYHGGNGNSFSRAHALVITNGSVDYRKIPVGAYIGVKYGTGDAGKTYGHVGIYVGLSGGTAYVVEGGGSTVKKTPLDSFYNTYYKNNANSKYGNEIGWDITSTNGSVTPIYYES
ncbi:MAG: CHAP domain-containing protein [Eubacterium sp.]|nr:CHAP domain-containing protein [Eubacterium sp.]